MKKFALLFAVMISMAQMSAATNDAAVNNEATSPEAPAAAAAVEDDDYNSSSLLEKTDAKINKHWSVFTDGFYVGMGINHNWDAINNSFEVGLLNVVGIKYSTLHGQTFSLGAGIHHRSYSMKRPGMLMRDNDGVVFLSTYPNDNNDLKNRSSNLNYWTVQFPLFFRQHIAGKLDLAVGGILNWNTYARVDNHYEWNKTDYDRHYKGLKQNKINIDVMGSLTWDEFGIYCRYTPSNFFKEKFGPEIKNTWTLGLMLGL